MNRRGFFKALGIAAAGAVATAVDPERLLWTPGATTHILPPPQGWRPGPQGLVFHKDAFSFVTEDLKFSQVFSPDDWSGIEDFRLRYLDPAVKALVERIDREIMAAMSVSCPVYLLTKENGLEVRHPAEIEKGIAELQEAKRDLIEADIQRARVKWERILPRAIAVPTNL